MIEQLIGVVIIYTWIITIFLFIEKNYRADEKESDQDTRKILTIKTAFTLFIIGMVGVNIIKSVFNITFDFLNVTLTKQILWGTGAITLFIWMILRDEIIKNILDKVIVIIGLAIFLLP